MSFAAIASTAIVAGALIAVAFGPDLLALGRRLARRPAKPAVPAARLPDPGRELRAERRAERLLADVLGEDELEAYRALGFLHAPGGTASGAEPTYGYLIYPHRPIVSYDIATGELLGEHCVGFPDREDVEHGGRLPDADDVLAKWMALRGDERGLIGAANMHLPGRQIDPDHVRRDIARLSEWTGRAPASRPAEGSESR